MSDRTPFTDALDTLGKIIGPNEKRDAIHLAVEPVVAGMCLSAGEHVYLKDGKAFKTGVGRGLGIVDPFLREELEDGQMFWLVVYPRQIKSLRHVWEHPAFPQSVDTSTLPQESEAISEAKRAITIIASDIGADYDEIMRAADDRYENDEYWNEGDRFDSEYISGDDATEFWRNYAIITGKIFKDHGNFLSCSC